ncbi:hypothetical protein O0L34_g5248 [Tuta absoluta]|nr:hypothetical protein O0L34_g5248 [Tuta absoluta]
MKFVVLVTLLCFCSARDMEDKLDRYIFACHSTDFECFRRQYKSLRDHVLLGNKRLGIQPYEPYSFQYEKNTCIKLAGLESSELTGIHLDNVNREFTWTLELPFKIQQVLNTSTHCIIDSGFSEAEYLIGNEALKAPTHPSGQVKDYRPLKKFAGNATIQVTYPFQLKKKKMGVHMSLSDENLDVILDIPDLSHYNNESHIERNLYELSEWAYAVVQNIDAAQNFALPYTSRFRTITEILPMRRFFTLYPDEDFSELNFKYSAGHSKCYEKLN